MGNLQKMMVKDFPYWDINQSKWFEDLTEEACQNSERHDNRIYIFFDSEEKAQRCMGKCDRRNISHTIPLHDIFHNTYRIDILMNWKEGKPSRVKRNQGQILY